MMKKAAKSEISIFRKQMQAWKRKKPTGILSQLADAVTVKTIYKLERHQAELELQNVELTKARAAAQEAVEKLQLKNENLYKMNAEKDKFFSIIAHDLRGPSNGFLGLTELMAEELPNMTPDEIQKTALLMRNSAANLFQLLGNLLEWSRIQRGLASFVPASFVLMPKISEMMVSVLEAATKKSITIGYAIPEDLIVYADEQMLGGIIRNLVSNAVKFTPIGGSIIVTAQTWIDKSVEISIKDSGIGMNKQMIDHLFHLDVNTNRKGTEGELSTGFGLIICKDLIEKHGGQLWVESEEGRGSTFRFSLPANRNRENETI